MTPIALSDPHTLLTHQYTRQGRPLQGLATVTKEQKGPESTHEESNAVSVTRQHYSTNDSLSPHPTSPYSPVCPGTLPPFHPDVIQVGCPNPSPPPPHFQLSKLILSVMPC
ncbi:hypothetical protein E2C01_027001 [Portunus trituberculatus]|uniref:Uncharacterized protein n=1 Tax=Portunus trituberculatus TaxID=210409 RepID=A0A5B7EKE0_PORTR|nr:hypothetical protein [Portunus trituberculatus]